MGSRKTEWSDETPESKENRLLAFQTIEEATSLKKHSIARWLVKYIFSLEVYGIGEPHPSNEYLCDKYNAENNGHCSVDTMKQEIWWAKQSEFITTTGRGKTRTFELNVRFLTDEMAKLKGLQLKREQERARAKALLGERIDTLLPNLLPNKLPNNLPNKLPNFEGQNNRGNFAPNSNSNSKGGGKLKKERKKQGTYDEIFEKMEVSSQLKEAFVEFIKFRKLAKSPMTDKAIELAIKKVRKLASTEPEQIAIIEQSIERGWKGLFPLKENDNPQSRAVSETQVRPLDVSEAMTQNPNVKKLFDLWEDCFGIRPLETAENIAATEALLDRFRDKATWLIGGLARSKNDNYVPKEFSTIATPNDLWKKSDLMWNYILNHKDEWKKADEFQAAFN